MRSLENLAAAVCVALLLVTAGCSAGLMPASTTTSPTDTTGTSPNDTVTKYPPGVADNGTLTDSDALVNAHLEATAGESLVFTDERDYPDKQTVYTFACGPTNTTYYVSVERSRNGSHTRTESYQRSGSGLLVSHGFLRHESENGTSLFVEQNASAISPWLSDGPYAVENDLRSLFTFGNYSVDGTVERDGRTLVELTAESAAPNEDSTPTYESRVLITPEGVVYEAESSFSRDAGDEREYRNASLSLDTDVEWTGPPSWVGDLPHLSLSIVEDGRALELRNTGGASLPANVTFDVTEVGLNATKRVTTRAPLEPGEAVYVTADANGTSVTLTDDSVGGEHVFPGAKLQADHGNTTYALVTGKEDD